jgi:hypothetical protein
MILLVTCGLGLSVYVWFGASVYVWFGAPAPNPGTCGLGSLPQTKVPCGRAATSRGYFFSTVTLSVAVTSEMSFMGIS